MIDMLAQAVGAQHETARPEGALEQALDRLCVFRRLGQNRNGEIIHGEGEIASGAGAVHRPKAVLVLTKAVLVLIKSEPSLENASLSNAVSPQLLLTAGWDK
jgi:hypothetical protein